MRTVAVGFITAIVAQLLVGTSRGAQAAGGLAAFPGQLAQRLLNPDIPAVPDLRQGAPARVLGAATAANPSIFNPGVSEGALIGAAGGQTFPFP
jgi:hypothetical protein